MTHVSLLDPRRACFVLIVAAVFAVAACDDTPEEMDDAGTAVDAGPSDAGPDIDAGSMDGGSRDAGPGDDAAAVDAGADATTTDAGTDAGPPPPPAWGTPVLLETASASPRNPRVAMDNAGNATVTFDQQSAGVSSIFAVRFEISSSTFAAPTLLETDDVRYAGNVGVGMDGPGNAIAAWVMRRTSSSSSGLGVWASRYDATGPGWGTGATIEAETRNVFYPFVAMNVAGTAIVVWRIGWRVLAARYQPTGGWQTPVELTAIGSGSIVYPRVALNAGGDAVAVWTQNDGGRTIWSSRLTGSSGAWSTSARLDIIDTEDAQYPRPVLAADGTALVVWEQRDAGGRASVWANRYDPSGAAWDGAAVIEAESAYTDRPVIAMDGAGNATCVWVHDTSRLWANHYDAISGTWGATPVEITTGVASSSDFTDHDRLNIGSDSAGNVIVIWEEMPAGDALMAAHYDAAGAAWGAPVAAAPGRMTITQRAFAMNASGVATLTWIETDSSGTNLWGVRFD